LKSAEEKQAAEISKNSNNLRAEIGRVCGKYNLTDGEFAHETGMTVSTLCRRLKRPEDITYGELCRIKARFAEFTLSI